MFVKKKSLIWSRRTLGRESMAKFSVWVEGENGLDSHRTGEKRKEPFFVLEMETAVPIQRKPAA
jgi:hypothetical protein